MPSFLYSGVQKTKYNNHKSHSQTSTVMKKFLVLSFLSLASLSLSAKTIKEFVVTTQPQMTCKNCENKIKKNMRFEKGVTNIQTDLKQQIVIVTYDADKTNEANLTNAMAKLGYKTTAVNKLTPTAPKK